jgi:DNA polymerase I-like protein with 3'-5' exonuclease and polymerase domains
MNYLKGLKHLPSLCEAETIFFDCETTGLQPIFGGLRLLQLATFQAPPVVIDCWDLKDDDWVVLEEFFDVEREWVAHNAVFDLGWLQEHCIYPRGRVLCTMLASRVLTNGLPNIKNGLQPVVKRYLGKEISKEEQRSDWSVPELRAEQIEYAAYDVELLSELYQPIQHRMADGGLHKAWYLECAALPAMAQLWRTGLPFDKQMLEELRDELEGDNQRLGEQFIVELDEALPVNGKLPRDPDGSLNLRDKAEGSVRAGTKKPAGFNINSPHQLKAMFTTLLGEVPVGPDGKPSASKAALREYVADHPIISKYLSWKRVEKRRQMVESLLKFQCGDGFIRASYLQMGADTGRMSCMGPNLMQIPRDNSFRRCVKAPEGWVLVDADFAQMELRLAAAEAQDQLMIRAFQEDKDLHTLTAMQIYGVGEEEVTKEQRQIAKSANFGLLFGSGARGLRNYAGAMGIQMSMEEAAVIRDKFHGAYTGIHKWQRQAADAANRSSGNNAFIRIRVSGLRRFLPGEHNKLTTRANSPIQGAGAAVMKRAISKLWPALYKATEDEVKLAGAIHDEILLLVREDKAEVWVEILQKTMEAAEAEWLGPIPASADANYGRTWAEAKG